MLYCDYSNLYKKNPALSNLLLQFSNLYWFKEAGNRQKHKTIRFYRYFYLLLVNFYLRLSRSYFVYIFFKIKNWYFHRTDIIIQRTAA